jgi:hypothetical protein
MGTVATICPARTYVTVKEQFGVLRASILGKRAAMALIAERPALR